MKKNSSTEEKVFKDFAEYWSLVKVLTQKQRDIITDNLSFKEQESLKKSYQKEGWQDLFMRNMCDYHLDVIKKNFEIDLLEIRCSVLSGQPYLMNKNFWEFVNGYFQEISWEYISYIFDGIKAEPYDSEYVKLVKINKKK